MVEVWKPEIPMFFINFLKRKFKFDLEPQMLRYSTNNQIVLINKVPMFCRDS